MLRAITDFIFINHEPVPVDMVFIPGSSKHQPPERAAELFRQGYSKFILPSGKFTSKLDRFGYEKIQKEEYLGPFATEWEFSRNVLLLNGVPSQAILCENESANTFENAFFSRRVTDSLGITVNKAIICCQAFHARRAFMTYSLAYPYTEFYVVPSATQGISAADWFTTAYGISRVMGELKKCGMYFEEHIKDMSLDKISTS